MERCRGKSVAAAGTCAAELSSNVYVQRVTFPDKKGIEIKYNSVTEISETRWGRHIVRWPEISRNATNRWRKFGSSQ